MGDSGNFVDDIDNGNCDRQIRLEKAFILARHPKLREVLNMVLKKTKRRRELSFDDRFIWAAFIIFLIVLLMIGITKFASLKTLFWLE